MKNKSKQELLLEIDKLQKQLSEAKRTIETIRTRESDGGVTDLAESRQAEETPYWMQADREKRALLSALVESIADEVWFVDTQKRFTLLNANALQELDLTPAQAIETERFVASLEGYRSDGSPRPVEEAPPLRALNGEVIRNLEEILRFPASGELQYRLVSATPVRDATGNILGSVSVVRDITERKRKENVLQEAHKQLRWLARFPEENPHPVVRVSAEGNILYLNYLNTAAAELPGWRGGVGDVVAAPLVLPIKQAMTSAGLVHQDLELGGRFYSVAIVPFPAEGYLNVYGIDITERKQAEEENLYRAAKLQAIIEAMSDAVLIYDTEMKVAQANPSFLVNYGFDPVGLHLTEIIARVSCRLLDGRPLVLAEQPTPLALHGEKVVGTHFLVRRADGSDGVVDTSAGPIRVGELIIGSVTVWHDITASKQTEEAVRESEARFRLLSETAGRLLAAEDPQEVVNDVCRAVMELLDCQTCFHFLMDEESGRLKLTTCTGIPQEDACKIELLDYGMVVNSFVAQEGVSMVADEALNVSASHTELVKAYGIQATARHLLVAGGRLLGTLLFGTRTRTRFSPQDLALMKTVADQVATAMERKRLLRELGKSHERLEVRVRKRTGELLMANLALQEQASLLDLAHDAIIVRDLHDRIVYWNRGAENTYGWTRDEALGKVAYDLLQTQSSQQLDEIHTVLMEGGRRDGELYHTTRSGSLMIVASRQALKWNADGVPTGILEINRDITQHKRAEAETSQAKAMLQMVFDGISDPLFMLAQDMTIKMLNKAAFHYFHATVDNEIIGRSCYDFPDGKRSFCGDCEIEKAISKGKHMTFERRGLFYPASIEKVTVYPLDESVSGLAGVIVGITDITESRKLEKHMTRVDRLSSLGQLSAGIAHEIRNPLAGINLFVDVLTDEARFQRTAQELDILEEIKRNIKKIDGIIKRVLDFSRQSESPILEKLDVSLLINDTLRLWRSAMTKAGIVLYLSVEADLPDLQGDAIELQQVLNNLLENAIDAMSGGGSLNITVRRGPFAVDENRQALIITLQDTGPGIPPEHRENIFNPFFTTKPAGTGLGLAISHRIITRHGGAIFCESTIDVGTTFRVEFPTVSGE